MQSRELSLPDAWIERIWTEMRATWGAAFDRQWECPAGEDPVRHVAALKAHWARTLAPYEAKPAAIRYALDHLPEQPQNLAQFRAACGRCPDAPFVALPAPKADPARIAQAVAKVRREGARHPQACAVTLRDRERAGQRLTQFQRHYWREVLGLTAGADQ